MNVSTVSLRDRKPARLLALAKKRQGSRWDGYNCIGDYHSGVYECDHMSFAQTDAGMRNAVSPRDSARVGVLEDAAVLVRRRHDPDFVKYWIHDHGSPNGPLTALANGQLLAT